MNSPSAVVTEAEAEPELSDFAEPEFPEFAEPEFSEFAAMKTGLEFPIESSGLSPFLVLSWVFLVGGWMDGFNSFSRKISDARLGARPSSS